jgi:hypothetical protein
MRTTRTTRTATLGRLSLSLVTAAFLLVACKGRGATGGCGVAGDCGGNPLGTWKVNPDLTCRFPVPARPVQNYGNTAPYFQPETGAVPPAAVSGTWCWDLSFDKDGNLSTPEVPIPNPDNTILGGTITFERDKDGNQSYTYILTAVSTTPVHLARSCLGVNGANLTCAELAVKLQMSKIGVNPLYANEKGTPAFRCVDAADGDGCDCEFDYIETEQTAVGDKGTWEQHGNVIRHYSIAGQGNLFETHPSRRTVRDATFCVSDDGQTLQLTGTNGSPLALKAGLRSLTLTKVPEEPDGGADAAGNDGAAASDGAGVAEAGGSDADDAGADAGIDADDGG